MPEICPRCAPGGCARDCAPGGCARDVPQVCFLPEVCPRCARDCAPGVHRQITELPAIRIETYKIHHLISY